MQSDMHYHGTYCMARAAGLSREHAQIAASAAQYVDDNVQRAPLVMNDGARLMRTPTAHHLGDEISNIDPDDQRDVWVPFHFLPGNDAEDNNYEERLKCRKNSEPARAMVDVLLDNIASDTQGLERLGITAHVYADTFSHYGFSGVSSGRNKVDGKSFRFVGIEPDLAERLSANRMGKLKRVLVHFARWTKSLANIKSFVAETATFGLGHGSVATYPDLPYLSWGFTYEQPAGLKDDRDNTATFLEACAALHDLFTKAQEKRPDFAGGTARAFASIEGTVRSILETKGDSDARAHAWQQAAAAGGLFTAPEDIPPYLGTDWNRWLTAADGRVDSSTALEHPACRFHLAANAHRSWVLHELLPSRYLLVA